MALTLQDDMDNVFLQSGFEEDIVYTSGGVAKTISAIIYREGSVETGRPQRGITRRYDIAIDISTDSTNGIATVSVNADKVKLYKTIGDPAQKTFIVAGVIQSDVGALRLGLR